MHRRSRLFPKKRRFVDLSKNRRADLVFRLKHSIQNGKYRNFATWDILDEGVSWSDIYFIGSDKFTLWNATIETTANAHAENLNNECFSQAYNQLSKEEIEREFALKFEPIPGSKLVRLVTKMKPTYPQFEGRTFMEEKDRLRTIVQVDTFEKVSFYKSYRYGIGLSVVLDVPILTSEIIADFVDRFVKDEREWKSSTKPQHLDGPIHYSNALNI